MDKPIETPEQETEQDPAELEPVEDQDPEPLEDNDDGDDTDTEDSELDDTEADDGDDEDSTDDDIDGDESETVSNKPEKAIGKLKKRINQVTGKLKEKEEETEHLRAELQAIQEGAKNGSALMEGVDPSFQSINGKPIHEATDRDVDDWISGLNRMGSLTPEQKAEYTRTIERNWTRIKLNKERYNTAVNSREEQLHESEWRTVRQELQGADIGLTDGDFQAMAQYIAQFPQYQGGTLPQKMKAAEMAMRSLGIDKQLLSRKQKPAQSIGKPKAKRPAASSSKRVYTEAEIEKMSPAEYSKNRADILKAMEEGRVK